MSLEKKHVNLRNVQIYIEKKKRIQISNSVFLGENACYWRSYCKFKCKHHQFIWHSPMTTNYVVFATFLLSPKNSYISILTASHHHNELESQKYCNFRKAVANF